MLSNCSLKTLRLGQNKVGELMEFRQRDKVIIKKHGFENFEGAWIMPRDERRQGVILYLHGGGYTCGDIEYAIGVGATLAVQTGTRVFSTGYRLAPEHPFPAACDDVLEAYRYLLNKGYLPSHITLCGESAGGGLCYSLCLKLKELSLPLPCGIIAISPWVDLTVSGRSYEQNRDSDPSMTIEALEFFANSYTKDKLNPLASPLFAELTAMPPSLIFSAKNEIMLSDAEQLHKRLKNSGCESTHKIKAERWHAYLLYGLAEDRQEINELNSFLNKVMAPENKLRWMRLDNAAKIYPASRNQNWSNVFRLSMTLKEKVDVPVLQNALDVTVRRFPSIAVRLRRGVFWYYLQQLESAPEVREEYSYPLTRMTKAETRKCAFRVIAYDKRIAVEIFHSLTDGTGALIFLKSLVAEYLSQKHGVHIPANSGVLGRLEEPSEAELEDSFLKYSGKYTASRKEDTAWKVTGTPESSGFLNLTCFELPVKAVLEKAHEYKVTMTTFLCAALMSAIQNLQKEKVRSQRFRKPIKVLLPVNLRNLFESSTLRNFALYTTPEIMPKLGEYSFEEICNVINHYMGIDVTKKQMSMKIATNVNSETLMAVRVMPLFIKNLVMKAVFKSVGEKKSCLSLSNLGAVRLPDEMIPFIDRADFILGVQESAPYNCGVISFGDTLNINFISNIRESELEYHFHCVLRDMGLPVTVRSNRR